MTNSEKLRRAKIAIAKTMNSNDYATLYIGATSNLGTRQKRYTNLDLFKPLIETTSYNFAIQLEEALIEYGQENYSNCNKSPYSKGLVTGKSIYYIYMVADENSCPI